MRDYFLLHKRQYAKAMTMIEMRQNKAEVARAVSPLPNAIPGPPKPAGAGLSGVRAMRSMETANAGSAKRTHILYTSSRRKYVMSAKRKNGMMGLKISTILSVSCEQSL